MTQENQAITVRPNGPYLVRGGIPLVRKSQVMSEHGEPLAWQYDGPVDSPEVYRLCRCGQSNTKPFCDGSHTMLGFEGAEAADTGTFDQRKKVFEGVDIEVRDDHSMCMHAGFCGTRLTNVWKMLKESQDPEIRDEIIAMVQRCPSGTLVHALSGEAQAVEPDLPKEIVVVPEGPLWVTGGIPIQRRDGQPLEVRNRVTLCRCGASSKKPLCDGTHKEIGFTG